MGKIRSDFAISQKKMYLYHVVGSYHHYSRMASIVISVTNCDETKHVMNVSRHIPWPMCSDTKANRNLAFVL